MKDRTPISTPEPTPPAVTQVYCKTCPIANRWLDEPCHLIAAVIAEKGQNKAMTPGTTQGSCGGIEVRRNIPQRTQKVW